MRAVTYKIDGVADEFKNIRNAKLYLHFSFSQDDLIIFFRNQKKYIRGFSLAGKPVNMTEIRVDRNGRESFGMTQRCLYEI